MSKTVDYRKLLGLQSMYLPHEPVDTVIDGPSMTRQEFTEECDVNALMARYEKVGGGMPPVSGEMMYVDWTAMPSNLQDHMNMMLEAEDAFMSLPAGVRKEFDNDPVRFVEFAVNPQNLERMREWKLAPPAPVEPPPQRVELVNGGPPAAKDGPPGPS